MNAPSFIRSVALTGIFTIGAGCATVPRTPATPPPHTDTADVIKGVCGQTTIVLEFDGKSGSGTVDADGPAELMALHDVTVEFTGTQAGVNVDGEPGATSYGMCQLWGVQKSRLYDGQNKPLSKVQEKPIGITMTCTDEKGGNPVTTPTDETGISLTPEVDHIIPQDMVLMFHTLHDRPGKDSHFNTATGMKCVLAPGIKK